jgi:hypothetical protein
MDNVKRLVELEWRREKLEDEIKILKQEIDGIKERVCEHFTQTGTQNISIDGRTVYLRRELWASALNVDALAAYPGTAPLVKPTVHGGALSSWVREIEQLGEDGLPILPPEIKDAVKVSETFRINTRKS